MWAAILGIFPIVAGWINSIVGYFQAQAAEQTAANTAEGTAETAHQNDGSQSVVDQTSTDAQNSALDGIANQIDNPTPVVVVKP
jgi:hypothetical protein